MRVVGVLHKRIDAHAIARVLLAQAEREVAKKHKRRPMTAQRWREVDALLKASKQRNLTDERKERKEAARYRRFKSARPAGLREATWDWLLAQGLREHPRDTTLGALISRHGGVRHPSVIQDTIIELGDGTVCIVERKGAEALALDATSVRLVRLSDRTDFAVTAEDVRRAIGEGSSLDQIGA